MHNIEPQPNRVFSGQKRNSGDSIAKDEQSLFDDLMNVQRMLVKKIKREQALTIFGSNVPIIKNSGHFHAKWNSKGLFESERISILDSSEKQIHVDSYAGKQGNNILDLDFCIEEDKVSDDNLDLDIHLQGILPDPIRPSSKGEPNKDVRAGVDSVSSRKQEVMATGDCYELLDVLTKSIADDELRTSHFALKKWMKESLQSQKNLQKWDRKMGLRACHSKTMTRSTQSRMMLRTFLEEKCLTPPSMNTSN